MNMWLNDAMLSVAYNVAVWESNPSATKLRPLSSGSRVPKDTYVLFEFLPHTYTDISWFGTGAGMDSPYGDWVADGVAPDPSVRCHDKNLYDTSYLEGSALDVYAALGVDVPSKALTVSTGDCANVGDINKLCRFDAPATVSAHFAFNATKGLFWGGFRGVDLGMPGTNKPPQCFSNGVATEPFTLASPPPGQAMGPFNTAQGYRIAVPAQDIPFTLTIADVSQENDTHTPATPTLTSGACIVGTPHSITMTSSDPDNDPIRYGIDWDADGSVDQFVPPTGYVPSGTSQSASRTYSMAGTKTVRAFAQDVNGLSSPWATVTFSCAAPATGQCTDGIDNDGDGLLDTLDPDCTSSGGISEFSAIPPSAPPPPVVVGPDLTIRAIPSLVTRNSITRIHWSATNVQSCTVTGQNGDAWSGIASVVGGEASSPITQRTTYTLSCVDLNDAILTKTATVNIVPNWREL